MIPKQSSDENTKRFFKALGARYRAYRKARRWTVESMVDRGFNPTQFKFLESGQAHTLRTLLRISAVFGVHPSKLLKDLPIVQTKPKKKS